MNLWRNGKKKTGTLENWKIGKLAGTFNYSIISSFHYSNKKLCPLK